MELTFYDYWRSSSAYRVRIALNLKGVDFRGVEIDLGKGGQSEQGYLAVNPQGLVPALVVDGQVISQSLAIIEWLDNAFPEPPLFPADPIERSRMLALALTIAADVQPLQNQRVQKYLSRELRADDSQVATWVQHWIAEGLGAIEASAPDEGLFGGEKPNIADIYLVPQMYNARRYKLSTGQFPRCTRIDNALCALDAFAQAAPEAVKSQ